MELTSTEFIILLPIAVLLYYLVPGKAQKYCLLLLNLLFYASFGYQFIAVIVFEAVIAWVASYYFSKNVEDSQKNCVLVGISVVLFVGILLFYKLGSSLTSSIVAPLGISFYTLQAISYVIDVKRRVIPAEKSLLNLIIYLSFFPTITSGPIYRYKDFFEDPQRLTVGVKPEYERIINGILYIIYGYFLKLVIAARAGIAVDKVFGDYIKEQYGGIILAVVAVLYSIQIFTDFAGYSAIVIGIAQILGYSIPENFLAPYLSMSVREFWGRWHISFSSWLKDYVYIPLGGNRKGKLRKYLNVLITFAVSGIWHGVNGWHFLVWGLLHGSYQVIGDCTRTLRQKCFPYLGIVEGSYFHRLTKRLFAFSLVTIAWVFFRTGVSDALRYLRYTVTSLGLKQVFGGGFLQMGLSNLDWTVLVGALLIMVITDIVQYRKGLRFDAAISSQGVFARCVIVIALSLYILIFGIYGDQHDASYFIYRGF